MNVNAEGIALIKRWEGFKADAYLCPAGVWTIGYGHTKNVKPGDRVTEAEAEAFLREDLADAENTVLREVHVPLSDGQFAALVSFVFNLGAGNFAKSTLLKKLNAGDYDAVPAELMKWDKARVNGRLVALKGLTNRRAAEAGLWARGEHVASRDVQPEARKLVVSKEAAAAAAAGAGGMLTAAKGDDVLSIAVGVVIVVAAITIAFLVIRSQRNARGIR